MLGAHLSHRASWSESAPSVAGVDPLAAAAGGMCMVFGARLAAGCTRFVHLNIHRGWQVRTFFLRYREIAHGLLQNFVLNPKM